MSKQKTKSKKQTRAFLPTFFITLFALSALGGLYFIIQGDNLISDVFPFANWGNNQNVSSKTPQQNGYGLVVESDAVENDYFDDAAFVGDSLTVGMKLTDYVNKNNLFGIVGVGIKAIKTEKDTFNGKETTALKAAGSMKPKKIYIMLGTNSIGYTSTATMIEQYAEVIDLLKKSNPNATFYIQSIPPMTKSYINSNPRFKPKQFAEFNEELEALATAKECYFLDTYSLFVTESGYLPRDLSTDGLHLNQDAYDIMFEYIKTHTVQN
ncbi:MAG: GDSL-type esterase/lipase family protein [Clostridiales bacterium]|nr:GDSL-type esterase/lipase family protein [Clostridiales bacterium]